MIIYLNNIRLQISSNNLSISIYKIITQLYNTYSNPMMRTYEFEYNSYKSILVNLMISNKEIIIVNHTLITKNPLSLNFSFIRSINNRQLNAQTYYNIANILERYI